eukprot:5091089-Pyramimonas_sp.AAC.1
MHPDPPPAEVSENGSSRRWPCIHSRLGPRQERPWVRGAGVALAGGPDSGEQADAGQCWGIA